MHPEVRQMGPGACPRCGMVDHCRCFADNYRDDAQRSEKTAAHHGQAKGDCAPVSNPQPLPCGIVKQMRRFMHIAVALLAVFLLVRPFDCFANGKFDQKAAACCHKGKCSPSNSDDCCKATVPGGNQFVMSKAPDHSSPVLEVAMAVVPTTTLQLLVTSLFVEVQPTPGSPPDFRLNLPLLI